MTLPLIPVVDDRPDERAPIGEALRTDDAVPAAVNRQALAGAAPAAPDWSGIPGLTMARALLHLPGRDQVYARVLRQFADHYRAGLPGLDAALQAARWTEAQQQLHALCGACGAVGANEVMAQSAALQRRLDDAATWDAAAAVVASLRDQASSLDGLLGGLIRHIEQRLADVADRPACDVNAGPCPTALDPLRPV